MTATVTFSATDSTVTFSQSLTRTMLQVKLFTLEYWYILELVGVTAHSPGEKLMSETDTEHGLLIGESLLYVSDGSFTHAGIARSITQEQSVVLYKHYTPQ